MIPMRGLSSLGAVPPLERWSLGYITEQSEQAKERKPKSSIPQWVSASVPASSFLPWLPLLLIASCKMK